MADVTLHGAFAPVIIAALVAVLTARVAVAAGGFPWSTSVMRRLDAATVPLLATFAIIVVSRFLNAI